jgi:hypothetical protein
MQLIAHYTDQARVQFVVTQKKNASYHKGEMQALAGTRLNTRVDLKQEIHQRTQDNRINTLITPDLKQTQATERSTEIMTLNSNENVVGYTDQIRRTVECKLKT